MDDNFDWDEALRNLVVNEAVTEYANTAMADDLARLTGRWLEQLGSITGGSTRDKHAAIDFDIVARVLEVHVASYRQQAEQLRRKEGP